MGVQLGFPLSDLRRLGMRLHSANNVGEGRRPTRLVQLHSGWTTRNLGDGDGAGQSELTSVVGICATPMSSLGRALLQSGEG
jgi:hypothetical protein